MTRDLFRMVYFTLLKIFKTGPVALTAFHSMAKTQPFPTLPLLGVKLTVHILLLLRVWMCGAIPPLFQMPSVCVKGNCTLFILSLRFKQLKWRWADMLQPDSSVPVQYSTVHKHLLPPNDLSEPHTPTNSTVNRPLYRRQHHVCITVCTAVLYKPYL